MMAQELKMVLLRQGLRVGGVGLRHLRTYVQILEETKLRGRVMFRRNEFDGTRTRQIPSLPYTYCRFPSHRKLQEYSKMWEQNQKKSHNFSDVSHNFPPSWDPWGRSIH